MKKCGYFAAVLSISTLVVIAVPPKAYADINSEAEIAALKTQLQEMAIQQKNAIAVIEKLSAQVDKLQKETSLQANKVTDIQKQQTAQASDIKEQQAAQATRTNEFASIQPPADNHGGGYVGVLGGWGSGGSTDGQQLGTAFFAEAVGGPQTINATGRVKTKGTPFVGVQAGYEWSNGSKLLPAIEVEALHLLRTEENATLANQNNLMIPEQLFSNAISTSTSVVLANAVVGLRTPYENVIPYVGGGIGAAYISTSGATSTQLDPAEPGINHFNTDRDSAVLAPAAQLKAGVRMSLSDSTYLFGEYRYLYVAAHEQNFGPTVNATHVPTSEWTVGYDGTSYSLTNVGVGVRF